MTDSSLSASRLVVDHDVAARIARGHNLLRRPVHDAAGVAALEREVVQWMRLNGEVLTKRFTGHGVADSYRTTAEPFVTPNPDAPIGQQLELLHEQLRHQVTWLEELRLTIPHREEPPGVQGSTATRPRRRTRTPAVVAPRSSNVAATVVGAVARATGMLPVVVEREPGDEASILQAAEQVLPTAAVAVVVVEANAGGDPAADSLLALGYAAGALGAGEVIAVHAPEVRAPRVLHEFRSVRVDDPSWREILARLLAETGMDVTPLVP